MKNAGHHSSKPIRREDGDIASEIRSWDEKVRNVIHVDDFVRMRPLVSDTLEAHSL